MKNFSFRLNGKSLMVRLLPVSALSAMSLLSACVDSKLVVPQKLAFDRSPQAVSASLVGEEQLQRKYSESDTPKMPPIRSNSGEKNGSKPAEALNEKSELTVSFDQMPLPTFIQAVYGGVIKTNYSMDAVVAARTDLVTFHTPRPQTPNQMANLARMLLKSYGIAVQDFGGVIRIVPDSSSNSYSPQIRRGRAQPDTPMSLRPVFHYVELEAVRVNDFSGLLRTMFGTKIQTQDDLARNAILLSGQSDDINAAMEVIQVFDQPIMRGQKTKRISPVFWTADEFSKRLVEVLSAEGYAASTSIGAGTPILVLPIAPVNSVIIFSSSETILNHALKWAKELDRPSDSQAGGAFFTYPVKNADAQALAKTLSELIGGAAPAPLVAGAAPVISKQASKIVVNNATNSLIIKGGGPDEYRQWMALLAELDKPTKSALIDVMVAEVSAGTSNNLGVDWSFKNGSPLSTGAFPTKLGPAGLSFNFINSAASIRADVTALATKQDAQILSSPKLMARNGETATIQVADEVPISTGVTTTPGSSLVPGTTTNTVQYRTAGMILKIRPVINSGNRIDLDISQEVSNVKASSSGPTITPTIGIRKVETKLTLKDGATVMLAGLISNDNSTTDSGVPLLKDIPGIGSLFKNQVDGRNKKELIILITPYIINDDFEAESITNAFRSSLGEWARDLKDSSLSNMKPVVPLVLVPLAKDVESAPSAKSSVSAESTVQESSPQTAVVVKTEKIPPVSTEKNSAEIDSDIIMSTPEAVVPPKSILQNATDKKSQDQKKSVAPQIIPGTKGVTDQSLLEELMRAVGRK
jgi:general secretion pathway protein D